MYHLFLEQLRARGLSPQTILNYTTSWQRFTRWMGERSGAEGVPDIAWTATQKDIADFKRYLLNAGGRDGKPAKPATVDLTFRHLKAIFRFFGELELIPDNPVEHVDRPQRPRRTPKWLSRNEQNALLRGVRATGDVREYAVIMFFLRTGSRVHELCDVRRDDLSVSERKGVVYFRGKGDKDREVPIGSELRGVLQKYLDTRQDSSPYLFTSQRSSKCSTRAIQHLVEKYRARTSIDHLTCHTLRHTFGHDLVAAGTPLDVVSRLMGHFKEDGSPNIDMTAIYTTPDFEDLEKAIESIGWN